MEATEPQPATRFMRMPWGLWALGVFLAVLVYFAGYDNSGREPPCFGLFDWEHPGAVELRSESRGIEQTCTAIAADGSVIAVKHFPGLWGWIAVGLALIAPVSIRAIWRRHRWRGLALAFAVLVATILVTDEIEDRLRPDVGAAYAFVGNLEYGHEVGTLTFPKFGKTVTVRVGFDQASVDRGPSWYPRGSLPGMDGTTYVAGHRRSHGGPFREIGNLQRGDRVVFRVPYAVATYTVTGHRPSPSATHPSSSAVATSCGSRPRRSRRATAA